MSTLTIHFRRPSLRRLGLRLSAVIERLNAYIDSRPLPRHRRLGSWLRIVSESG